jgi:hypothetical protein
MLSRTTQIELVWGQKWENKQLRVFATSKYPGFSVNSLEGVLLSNKDKKHWFNGFSVGMGMTPGWDLFNSRTAFVIGPTFSYNIYTY